MLIKESLSCPRRDRGSALMAVIGIMAVTVVVGMTVTTATLQSLTVTSVTRASVQALAAAEAGVDDTALRLGTTGSCSAVGGVYSSVVGAVPKFKANVQIPDGAGWKPGCPST